MFAIRGFSPCRLEGKVFIDLEAWALGSFRAFSFGGFLRRKTEDLNTLQGVFKRSTNP